VSTLEDWTAAVVDELGLAGAVDGGTRDLVLDLARDVAHGVARPAAPLTAFLLGLAAGRADDPVTAARALADRVTALATGWPGAGPAAGDAPG
jgi:hypothetical protein